MAHPRRRFITEKILRKLRYSPVVALQGARQTGKSFFARDLLKSFVKTAHYLTFDQESVKLFAERDIESFLLKNEDGKPLVIDEAQKVPKLFDAIKFRVDEKRVPGSYILLGSTEFSKLMLIRESLTGRISRVPFYPLTISEALQLEYEASDSPFFLSKKLRISRKELLKHLDEGGLPGLFAIRSKEEKKQALQDWVDLTVHRDIHSFPKLKLDSALCLRILVQIATLEEPSAGMVASTLKVDLRRIKTHLTALQTLFAIQAIPPHPLGTGKPLYYLFDVGIAQHLGAGFHRQMETFFLQEYLAKKSFEEQTAPTEIFFYRTSHGSRLSFVEESKDTVSAVQIYSDPKLNKKSFYLLEGFVEKAKLSLKKKVLPVALLPHENVELPKGIRHFLWESMG